MVLPRCSLASYDRGYSLLREEPAAWKRHVGERNAWDATLNDGLPASPTKARRKKR